MAHLSLSLPGPFEVALAGEPVTDFESDKVRALCTYLVVEAHRPHRRDSLAGLLWSDWSDRAARTNLRNALANLRTAIGDRTAAPPCLRITREAIQFNTASDHWLDVAAFTAWVEADPPTAHELEEAVALYRGSFLEGFFLKDSPAFEDWSLLTRERLQRQALAAFHWLAGYHERRGEYERARDYAWRHVELESWQEEAHQQLMRLLALGGQRSAALAQDETCCRLLDEELGVEPAEETTKLYEQIRDGELKATIPSPIRAADPPSFLYEEEAVEVERPVFVARGRELTRLDELLDLALSGQARVVFVTGEAGSGKTALTQEFARRAQEAHAGLVVANGNCNAYTGIGDPYLPFREILGLLTGGVEARWAAEAITREHARRLWNGLPLAAQALVEALSRPPEPLSAELHDLYLRGLVFIGEHTDDGPRYELIDAGRFMDSVLFDPRANELGLGYFDLWKAFAHEELWPATGNEPWNFRVLPIGEAVQPDKRIMPHEEAAAIVAGARRIAVQECPCRKRDRNCDNPLETCLSLNELADYVLYRDAGREIDAGEALSILKECAGLGLVHQTVNTDQVDVVCNCRDCCCGILTPLLTYGMDKVTAKSRFRATVDAGLCSDCLWCVERCVFGALEEDHGLLRALLEKCFGCGMCVPACPTEAITLVEVREPEHIPVGTPGFNMSRVPVGG